MTDRIEILLFHDVLCGWSLVADLRLRALQEELDGLFTLEYRPFPTRVDEMIPNLRERRAEASALRKVAKERETRDVRPDLWRGGDPPRTSLPPLIAMEAARIVGGPQARDRLLWRMRRAAFESGINVAREDVILELAERSGIDLSRFSTAMANAGTKKLVLDAYERAVDRGIESVPSVVIGGEWIMSGTRSIDEYRSTLLRYVERRGLYLGARVVH